MILMTFGPFRFYDRYEANREGVVRHVQSKKDIGWSDNHGYIRIGIRDSGIHKNYQKHRFIFECFHGKINDVKLVVDHINNIKTGNRNFRKRRVIVHNVDDIWCSDLVEMQKLSKWNKGYKYLFMVLDLFSKYGWIVPLKTKTGLEVSGAFGSIFRKAKPKKLWVDKGKEYYNKNVLDLLAKNNIEIYSTENEKSSVCERWNRTIKEKMYKRFTMQNNTVYIDILPKILASYNNSKNRSIGMTPNAARKPEKYGKVYWNLYGDLRAERSDRPAFRIGDTVRISKYKRKTFDKGCTPNWTEEVFVIDQIRPTDPITYKIRDLNGEEIGGTFYREELQKTDQTIFRIERVIRNGKVTLTDSIAGFH